MGTKMTYPQIYAGDLMPLRDGRYLWVLARNGEIITCVIRYDVVANLDASPEGQSDPPDRGDR